MALLRFVLLGALLALAQPCAAAPEPAPASGAWAADSRTGCKVWNPNPQPGEKVRWTGACVGGLGSGPGVTEWLEKGVVSERMEGGRVAGHLQGKGILTLPDGERFEGMWKDDRRNGPGTIVGADGKRLSGVWINDRLVGGPPSVL